MFNFNWFNVQRFHDGCYERGGRLRHNAIAVPAQSSHAAGYPMSQRVNAGFRDRDAAVGVVGARDSDTWRPSRELIGVWDKSLAPSLWSRVDQGRVVLVVGSGVCSIAATWSLTFVQPPLVLREVRLVDGKWSKVFGVAHGLTNATVFRLLSVFPAALYVSVAGLPAIGVGPPADFVLFDRDPPQSIPFMRRTDATSRNNGPRNGI